MIVVGEPTLKAGADLFALDPSALRLLERDGAPDGAVYEVQQNGSHYFLKFTPTQPDAVTALREKLDFVNYLRGCGVGVVEFSPSVGGQTLEFLEGDGQFYAVSKAVKAPGRHLDPNDPRDWNPAFFRQWGRLMGRMHTLARNYDGGANVISWHGEHASFHEMCKDRAVRAKWDALGETIRALPQDRDAYGLIHNDLHVGNMLADGDRLTVLDFDVCTRSWFMLDIGIALFHPIWEMRRGHPQGIAPFVQHFMEGYSAENTLSRFWLDQIHTFLRYRQMLFCIVMTMEQPRLSPWIKTLRRSILDDEPIADVRL